MGTECQIYEMTFAKFSGDEKVLKVEDLGDDVPFRVYLHFLVFEMDHIHFEYPNLYSCLLHPHYFSAYRHHLH